MSLIILSVSSSEHCVLCLWSQCIRSSCWMWLSSRELNQCSSFSHCDGSVRLLCFSCSPSEPCLHATQSPSSRLLPLPWRTDRRDQSNSGGLDLTHNLSYIHTRASVFQVYCCCRIIRRSCRAFFIKLKTNFLLNSVRFQFHSFIGALKLLQQSHIYVH